MWFSFAALADAVLVAEILMPHKIRIRTLVVDDSPDFVCPLSAFLESLSNVDVIAKGRCGRDALVLAHEWVPDLEPSVSARRHMPTIDSLECRLKVHAGACKNPTTFGGRHFGEA